VYGLFSATFTGAAAQADAAAAMIQIPASRCMLSSDPRSGLGSLPRPASARVTYLKLYRFLTLHAILRMPHFLGSLPLEDVLLFKRWLWS
jgi:hypothetical protein